MIDRFVEHVTLVTHELQKHTSGDVRNENVTVNFEGTLGEKSLASSTILSHTNTCVSSRVFTISWFTGLTAHSTFLICAWNSLIARLRAASKW